ncbi:hypothetical protein P301_F10451 [Saccharomyces cerevisiae P301]|uniref:Uncharacterized protein YFR010W-A n=2 Tax=Saccharomyces cerevisiae TaxID=4932 RepID=YF010_YEAST|nr:RecName: Full=Uncharacterized protein YFR010W-A [Saccharomyces cerevisiae S288C]EWG86375.1 hypothetical protein R008_F10451 [Saccharomyces cerevisiae R008]EWG91278.1 hypothetical protein P301_F10451 [Saccharomyces cerevisiae P301]EWG96179.1 hypothetical protein R103_F20071 [Saccharomyces cerevisiae R103]KZV11612.1 hypothetical protein WN66_02062 [Saccharomyces cerevisiae]WNV72275.1 hypothetical protein O6U65_1022 [Saccharomyces cerevisiae synthetic construct]CAY79461.1 EC1118_1F14_1024p [S
MYTFSYSTHNELLEFFHLFVTIQWLALIGQKTLSQFCLYRNAAVVGFFIRFTFGTPIFLQLL